MGSYIGLKEIRISQNPPFAFIKEHRQDDVDNQVHKAPKSSKKLLKAINCLRF
ncbi:hypothetical protein PHSC3_001417 [Chlamydiales bacterium STE3]|nr:hypothetical protein PHSC3_001417 [Chlamydiales bacterium STE3]